MKKEIVHLPNSELELMLIIWESEGRVTRADIQKKLVGHDNWGPTTILKFLSRLVDKGFIACESAGKREINYYTPLISEEEYLAVESKSVLGRFVGRSMTNLVANLYENNSIDDEELDQLQVFISSKRGK